MLQAKNVITIVNSMGTVMLLNELRKIREVIGSNFVWGREKIKMLIFITNLISVQVLT